VSCQGSMSKVSEYDAVQLADSVPLAPQFADEDIS
jgi:hypothetical protein